jgi:hypothetical protein
VGGRGRGREKDRECGYVGGGVQGVCFACVLIALWQSGVEGTGPSVLTQRNPKTLAVNRQNPRTQPSLHVTLKTSC